MAKILKFNEGTALAFHAMIYIAAHENRAVSVKEIAKSLKASEGHLSKIMQILTKSGLLKSQRGPQGGFKLGKKSNKIKLIDIFEAVEGKYEKLNCLFEKPLCNGEKCILGNMLINLNSELNEYLSHKTIDALVEVFK
ncbi:MAG: Rrf2 family transcriptional regulator [Candidatus Coatesbacteria bacterium]|nr:Rrf2 family transcriptional regulator [Candidatus Coatesbacteria bacterium]